MKNKYLFALAASLSLCANAFADVYESSFEGNWHNETQSGRGVNVDYVPLALGSGVYYIVAFTYDLQGNPTWVQYIASGREGQRLFKNVDVFRVTGGTPGNTFPAFSAITSTKVGTATVDMASCSKIKLDFTPLSSANLPPVNLDLTRLDSPGKGSASCPFNKEFTACPTGTTAVAGVDRVCEIPAGTVTGDLRLSNTATYRLGGRVAIGGAMALSGVPSTATGRLFVEPGTVVRGNDAATSRLVVNPGSKIFAEGTPSAPIVFTGITEVADATVNGGTWAGLIIAGRAPINDGCTGGGTSVTCAFEADSAIVWGGTDANDSSGVLKYVQIRSSGGFLAPNVDLNGLTMGGVGAGTLIDFVQTAYNGDDGFEMFGGTVNLKHIVALGNNDDNIDTDFGYSGKIQYAYIKQGPGIDSDSHGIESDNAPTKFDAVPRTRPVVVNATFDGVGLGFDGARIRRGSAYVLQNVVFVNFTGSCLNFNDAATYDATRTNGAFNGVTTISGAYFGCSKQFDDQAADPFLLSTFVNAQAENVAGAATGLFNADGRTLLINSPLRTTAQANADSFFERYGAKGAFVDGDWTQGWTIGL
jgi:hypothetical protein